MAQSIAGTCYIKVDGEQLSVEGSVKFPMMDKKRTTLIDASGKVAGFKEEAVIPHLDVSAFVDRDFPLDKLANSENMTVTVECANGMVYTLQGAYLSGESPEISPSDGNVTLHFEAEKHFLQQ